MIATVQDRQSIYDVALQYFGTAAAAFIVAERLKICVTDNPKPGSTFEYHADEVADQHVVDYYAHKGIIPTTASENTPK